MASSKRTPLSAPARRRHPGAASGACSGATDRALVKKYSLEAFRHSSSDVEPLRGGARRPSSHSPTAVFRAQLPDDAASRWARAFRSTSWCEWKARDDGRHDRRGPAVKASSLRLRRRRRAGGAHRVQVWWQPDDPRTTAASAPAPRHFRWHVPQRQAGAAMGLYSSPLQGHRHRYQGPGTGGTRSCRGRSSRQFRHPYVTGRTAYRRAVREHQHVLGGWAR